MKSCTKCGLEKPLDAFTKDKRCPDGRVARCKTCWNAANRERYYRNHERSLEQKREAGRRQSPEKKREYARAYRERHPQRVKESAARSYQRLLQRDPDYFRRWYQQNIEKERERSRDVMRELRRTRPELEREWKRRYRERNIEVVRAREREKTYARRARQPYSPELAEYMRVLVLHPCVYCGATENITIDHVVPDRAGGKHEAENLVPACRSCNSSKCDRLLSEWEGRAD